MKNIIISLGFLLAVFGSLNAQERITLTAPETVPNNLKYRVDSWSVKEDDPDTIPDEGTLTIQLIGVERKVGVTCAYTSQTTPTGTSLIIGLNKANLSSAYAGNATTGTFKQRVFHRFVVLNEAPAVCGKSLAGSLTGTPQ